MELDPIYTNVIIRRTEGCKDAMKGIIFVIKVLGHYSFGVVVGVVIGVVALEGCLIAFQSGHS